MEIDPQDWVVNINEANETLKKMETPEGTELLEMRFIPKLTASSTKFRIDIYYLMVYKKVNSPGFVAIVMGTRGLDKSEVHVQERYFLDRISTWGDFQQLRVANPNK